VLLDFLRTIVLHVKQSKADKAPLCMVQKQKDKLAQLLYNKSIKSDEVPPFGPSKLLTCKAKLIQSLYIKAIDSLLFPISFKMLEFGNNDEGKTSAHGFYPLYLYLFKPLEHFSLCFPCHNN
jgi:hypothetical protein